VILHLTVLSLKLSTIGSRALTSWRHR